MHTTSDFPLNMKPWPALILVSLLAACAAYNGRGLVPGIADLNAVEQRMGKPAMRWENADGSLQLAYPRGPAGLHTYMVYISADGKLQGIENVLDEKHLQAVRPGMDKEAVLRLLGPPNPHWTIYFEARNELAWEWRYCDAWNKTARLNVLFDNTLGTVRSAFSLSEAQKRLCGKFERCRC